jgi:hypothetical protein
MLSTDSENGFSCILWSSSGDILPTFLRASSAKLEDHFSPRIYFHISAFPAIHLSGLLHPSVACDSLCTRSKVFAQSSATICPIAHLIASENFSNSKLSNPTSPSISNFLALNFSIFFPSPLFAAFSRNAVTCS